MPEQGTHGHITLLLAEHLAASDGWVGTVDLCHLVRQLAAKHGTFWSKAAREPGAEPELVDQALAKLAALGLVTRTRHPDGVAPRPALARYAVAETVVLEPGARGATGRSTRPQRKDQQR
jgi:uncharacterized protein (TIGR02678 family)